MRRVPVRLIRESQSPPRPERPTYTELKKIRKEALNERRRIHADLLVCGLIARELARNPDTMELNDKATKDALNHIIEWWERDKFAIDELTMRDWGAPLPPDFLASLPKETQRPTHSLNPLTLTEALESARKQTRNLDWKFPRKTWCDGIMMTPEAARRYIALIASKDNAERVLKRLGLTEEPSPADNDRSPAVPQSSDVPAEAERQAQTYRSGLAGRPTSWHLLESECRRRYEAGESYPNDRTKLESSAEWARVLIDWFKEAHRGSTVPQPKTLTNRLGGLLRELARGGTSC